MVRNEDKIVSSHTPKSMGGEGVRKIPVIERPFPVKEPIMYRGERYGISGVRNGLEYVGYSRLDEAIQYAHNWRTGRTHHSIIVKSFDGKKPVYFVCVTPHRSKKNVGTRTERSRYREPYVTPKW